MTVGKVQRKQRFDQAYVAITLQLETTSVGEPLETDKKSSSKTYYK